MLTKDVGSVGEHRELVTKYNHRRLPDEAYEDEVSTVRGGNGIQ